MKFNYKTGVLLVMLAIPVFIWLFLKFFGQNRYEVPVYYPEGISVQGCPQENQLHTIPDFTLNLITEDKVASENILANRITAVYFFSYPCDTACMAVMEELARVQAVFEQQEMVQILAIDGSSSNPQALAELPRTFKSNPAQWKFLTGEKAALETLIACGFVLQEHTDMSHPIVLIDGEKRIRGYYAGTDPEEVDRLMLEIRILLYNLKQDHA